MSDRDPTASAESEGAGVSARPSTLKGGIVGLHPRVGKLSLPVAPTDQEGLNTLRLSLLPIACWKLEDLRRSDRQG
jgi:hypothetical protein